MAVRINMAKTLYGIRLLLILIVIIIVAGRIEKLSYANNYHAYLFRMFICSFTLLKLTIERNANLFFRDNDHSYVVKQITINTNDLMKKQ